jgi:hypothetical protein
VSGRPLPARLGALLLAVTLGAAGTLGLLPPGIPGLPDGFGAPPVARGAASDLLLVTTARYVVDPAAAVVRVTVDITATNRRPETVTHRFYFDRAFLAVQPGATGFRITGPTRPTVRVSARATTHTTLRIDFGERLTSGRTTTFRLTFDIPDPGGEPDREIRVGDSLVAFAVWAFASEGASGSTVEVVFPDGYEVTFESGELDGPEPSAEGGERYWSGPLAAPLAFFAYLVATREGEVTESTLVVPVGGVDAEIRLRAWADDPAWAERVGGLFRDALPVLAEAIGLPWPRTTPLVVSQTLSRSAGGQAGRYDPAAGRMEVAYWAPSGIVLAEAAHTWFNGALLADRWASEGFATWYALRAAAALGIEAEPPATDDAVEAARLPLNAWTADAADPATEAYGYAASYALVERIVERVGEDALRAAWTRAAAGAAAYLDPARPTEVAAADGPPDWRSLLDLLEESSGASLADLWLAWVVRPDEAGQLTARAAARESLARTEALAGDWALPPQAREALRAWQFDAAEQILADARTVIAQRGAVEAAAEAAGLQLPGGIREPFERGDVVGASAIAATQFSAIRVLAGAGAFRPLDPDPLTVIGLLGEDPAVDLAAGHAAFAAGDVDAALELALAAQDAWAGAWEEGRRRAIFAVALLAAAALFVATLAGRARRFRAAATAAPSTARTAASDDYPAAGA